MKKLYMYQDDRNTDVKQFLLALPDKQKGKFLRQIAMLILPKDTLGRPQVKHFQMDRYRCLYELRDNTRISASALFLRIPHPAKSFCWKLLLRITKEKRTWRLPPHSKSCAVSKLIRRSFY